MNKWKVTKINQSLMMSRLDSHTNTIEVRSLNWLEKIIYWRKRSLVKRGVNNGRKCKT